MTKEEKRKKQFDYYHTPKGRAQMLYQCCKAYDRRANRPEGDLTSQWILENILSKHCAHCGSTDWTKIGCNRIDNSRSHTKDNVEPCCYRCNVKLPRNTTPVDQIDPKTGEVIKTWASLAIAVEEGFSRPGIVNCSNGGRYLHGKWLNCHTYKGYAWRLHA